MRELRSIMVVLILLSMCLLHVPTLIAQPAEEILDLQSKYRKALDKIERLTAALEKSQNDIRALRRQLDALQRPESSRGTAAQVSTEDAKYEKVLADLSREIEANPDHAHIYAKRGAVHMQLAAYTKALQDFDAAIARGAQDAVIYNQRGLTHFQLGHLQRAVNDFTQAIERNSELAEAYNNRGIVQRRLGDYTQTIRDLRQAVRLGLEHASPHLKVVRDEVRHTQQQLQRAGLQPGPADGMLGSQTLAALQAYQQRQGLPVTGRLDEMTKKRLGLSPVSGLAESQAETELLSHFVHRPVPEYPLLARQQGWEGTITLRVEMLSDGTVGQVDIVQSTGHQVLDEAAQRTVQQWRHDLLQQNSTSAAGWGTLNFTFALDKEEQ